MSKSNAKTTLVDRRLDGLKNTRPVALAIVVGAILVGVATVWNALPQIIRHDVVRWVHLSPGPPGDTGWIFGGYYNVETGTFMYFIGLEGKAKKQQGTLQKSTLLI